MKRFVEGVDRGQSTLFREYLDDWIDADRKKCWFRPRQLAAVRAVIGAQR
jgi:hypothetical protein